MTHKGVITKINEDTNEITFQFEDFSVLKKLEMIMNEPIAVTLKRWKEERSIAQNNFLWALIKDISIATKNKNRWSIYLELLRKHGEFTYTMIRPEAVDKFSKQWREVENLGEVKTEKGEIATQLRCYYGTHLYTTEEMSNFLENVIEEMKESDIKVQLSKEEKERYGIS